MRQELPQLPTNATAADALIFMREITKAIGPGFHPDSAGRDYVTGEPPVPSFTPEQADQLDGDIERAFSLLEPTGRDPYAIAGRVQRRLLGMPIAYAGD